MENRNFFQELTGYRVKVERNGKEIVNIPGIFCLPGLLTAPRLSIAGMIVAPLLGLNVHMENESGKTVDLENEVRKTAETVVNTAKETARTIREEIDKVWEAVSADDPESEENREAEETEEASAQEGESGPDTVGDPEIQDADHDAPAIQVNPDDSSKA